MEEGRRWKIVPMQNSHCSNKIGFVLFSAVSLGQFFLFGGRFNMQSGSFLSWEYIRLRGIRCCR